ncbi:response regulator [bacterium]|nr:response regulator [bacterium]
MDSSDQQRPAIEPHLQPDVLLDYKFLQSLRRLTRAVAHDYNNIFTGLAGQITLLEQSGQLANGTPRQKLTTDLIDHGVNRTAILHEFARPSAAAEQQVHSLRRIVDQTVAALQVCSRVHRFSVQWPDESVRLACRFKDMVLALFYLGENGVDAMAGGGTLRIVITVSSDHDSGRQVDISFRDTGPGIAAAVRDRLFAPFVSSTKPAPPGGLGLYAARTIVRRYVGDLSITDAAGGGTVATVTLPCHDPLGDAGDAGPEAGVGSPATGPPDRQVFFVVEDDEAMRDLIVTGLQRRGHVVFCTETAAEALEEYPLVHDTVTVLLIDIGLSDADGFACARDLLAISGRPRVLFMSGDEPDGDLPITGAGFLKKPFTIKHIEEVLRHGQPGRQG